jgi:hypothetical protein
MGLRCGLCVEAVCKWKFFGRAFKINAKIGAWHPGTKKTPDRV